MDDTLSINYSGETDRTNVTGNEIIASITVGDGISAVTAKVKYKVIPSTITKDMIEIEPISTPYSDTEISPVITVKRNGNSLTKGKDYTISGNETEKNVGNYHLTITGIGNYSGTETIDWNITPIELESVTVSGYTGTYDGEEHGITVEGIPSDAIVTYSTDGKTYSKTNPTFIEIGTNTVYYKVEKANYDTVTGSATVIISQAQNSWTTEPSIEGWTYGEDAKTPNKGTPKFGSDVKVEYKLATENDNQYSTIVPTNAGNYKVRFSVEGNANYTALSKEVGLTIAKKKVTVKAENNSKNYGKNDPTLTWKLTEGTLVQGDELIGISVSRATGEDVTTYTITASQTNGANPNYDITFVDGTFTINKKTIGINWGNTDFTYNGEPKLPTATATGVIGNDEIGLTVDGGQINAGTGYTATVTGITGDKAKNYQLPTDVTTTFNIAKADQSAPGDNSKPDTGKPYIEGNTEQNGWENIKDQLDDAKEKDTVTVEMNGTTVVPGDIFDTIKGKDVKVVFDLGNGITWTVNGKDITAEQVGDIDFGVTVGAQVGNTIPADIINEVVGERYSVNVSLAYDGEFGFTAILTVNVDKANVGRFANLFYYNPETAALEFMSAAQIDENGNAALEFTHASDYTVVLDTEVMSEDGTEDVLTDADENAAWNPLWVIVIGAVILIVGLGIFFVAKKKKEEAEK